jgi:tight adherence protein B
MKQATLIPMIIGLIAIVMVVAIGTILAKSAGDARAEERLTGLTGGKRKGGKKKNDLSSGILARPAAIDTAQLSLWTRFIPNAKNLNLLYEQADVNLTFKKFMTMVGGLGVTGLVIGVVFQLPIYVIPVGAVFLAALPFFWLKRRKARRIKHFLDSMPQAVDLISRALRAGHGLASGFHLVSEEMKGPIADEFNRVFEEQNLGIPVELALRNMAERIPVMDVRFFVISVIIQRTTGGDLAEVLDKIGRLIRQRFELQGHVKGLTAEGRLSGIVLLAMPPSLLGFLSIVNYEYISVLFKTPTGVKMLAITAVLQVLGALMINKIVAIKV